MSKTILRHTMIKKYFWHFCWLPYLYTFSLYKSKKGRQKGQTKKVKRETTIYETLHRKLKVDQHERHKKKPPEGVAVPAAMVTPFVLLIMSPCIVIFYLNVVFFCQVAGRIYTWFFLFFFNFYIFTDDYQQYIITPYIFI